MHAHDRTLLASLGFSDADKKDARHDMACQYLSDPERALAICRLCFPSCKNSFSHTWVYSTEISSNGTEEWSVSSVSRIETESPICKGEGKYKTTVGFLDVLYRNVSMICRRIGEYKETRSGGWSPFDREDVEVAKTFVEVKIAPVSTGEILRQVNLYRQYVDVRCVCVATVFPMTEEDIKQLGSAKVKHVFLGEKFKRFCDSQTPTFSPLFRSIEI